MIWLFNTLLYSPLLNLLIFFYNIIPIKDIGISIILITILIRLLLYPLTKKSLKAQKALQDLQPKMKEIQNKYKDDKEKQAAELIKLYKVNKTSPFSSCLPILIQLPVLIAVFQVFRTGLSVENLGSLYSFIAVPESINVMFLGFVNLAEPSIPLAIITAVAQYFQSKMMVTKQQPKVDGSEDENTMAIVNKQMIIMMPLLTLFIGFTMPGGLTLYWSFSTLFMIGQQLLIMKFDKKQALVNGEAVINSTDKKVIKEI